MDVYLIRHGQSEYNIGLTEYLDSGLTPLGSTQAARMAARMADEGLTHLYVSPLRRTLETAAPLCAATRLRAEVSAEICEFFSAGNAAYHTFQGLTPDEIERDFPWAFIGTTFPCELVWWPQTLETPAMLIRRAEQVRDALIRQHGGTDHRIAVISHADTVGRLMEAFLRVPAYPEEPPWLENCSVTHLRVSLDSAQPATLLYANDISHLSGLAP